MESSVKEGKTNAEGTKKFHRMALKVSKNFITDQNLKYQKKLLQIVGNSSQKFLFAKNPNFVALLMAKNPT